VVKRNAKSKELPKSQKAKKRSLLKIALISLKRVPKYIKIPFGVLAFLIPMYFVLRPKVIVHSDMNINHSAPFYATFSITNNSELPINNVTYSYISDAIFGNDNRIENCEFDKSPDDFRNGYIIENIPSGKSSTLNRNKNNIGELQYAKIKIRYSFNYVGLTFNDSTSFFCIYDTDKSYRWIVME
jgi:hypothetical protein